MHSKQRRQFISETSETSETEEESVQDIKTVWEQYVIGLTFGVAALILLMPVLVCVSFPMWCVNQIPLVNEI